MSDWLFNCKFLYNKYCVFIKYIVLYTSYRYVLCHQSQQPLIFHFTHLYPAAIIPIHYYIVYHLDTETETCSSRTIITTIRSNVDEGMRRRVILSSFLFFLLALSEAWLACPLQRTCVRRGSTTSLDGAAFRGRDIPYVETYEEQQLRFIGERDPFFSVHDLLTRVLSKDSSSMPKLRRLTEPTSSTTHSNLFTPLYDDTSKDPLEIRPYDGDKKRHFLLTVAYRGSEFCGWQRQPNHPYGIPAVQQVLEDWLQELHGDKVDVRVSGRTDAGVHAIGQVCRFRTFQELEADDVDRHLQNLPSDSLRVTRVQRVSRAFHPTFGATCRAYVYMIDAWSDSMTKHVNSLNELLQTLEGKELDYIALSYGRLKTQDSLCTLYHARASLVEDTTTGRQAVCIELVGNRFLRRMVRLLVATALRLALQQKQPNADALLNLIQTHDRLSILAPAPPDGLVFVGARFDKL
jgi:tRNA pseudouridine(38-40) synthase